MEKPQISKYGLAQADFEKLEATNKKIEELSSKIVKLLMVLVVVTILFYFSWQGVLIFLGSMYGPVLAWYILGWIITAIAKNHYFSEDDEILIKRIAEYKKDLDEFNSWFVRTKREFWLSLDGHAFEHEVANLFRKLGAHAEVTKGSGDEGIDIFLNDGSEKAIVQCKAHKKPVGPAVVRDLYGVMNHTGFNKAYLVTLNGVTKGAYKFIEGKNITILDLGSLIKLQLSSESN